MNKPIHFATKKLKQFRDDRDWSQQDMANYLTLQTKSEISRELINYWENRKRGMVAEKALEISKATGIELRELVNQK